MVDRWLVPGYIEILKIREVTTRYIGLDRLEPFKMI